jgi:hypothetical protein
MEITGIYLTEKRGGKSGDYLRAPSKTLKSKKK